ncbi:MAG: NADH-quinone oxidoreductase subunit F, partial [Odoribacter sp.]|nr:NADH-quinone oxidoreductase subunit F [Odoribacter sp.]
MDISRQISVAGKEWEVFTKGNVPSVFVGNATCGRSAGSAEVLEKFKTETARNSISCNIVEVGCIGMCYIEPVVGIHKPGYPTILYGKVGTEEAEEIVN